LLFLAPDWTESNVRSMVGMLKKFEGSPQEQTKLYRKFWAGIITKGFFAWMIGNLLLAASDDEYTFAERFKMASDQSGLKMLDWDVTPIYKALGYEGVNRKYFTFLGHFKDPFKFVTAPFKSARNKASVLGNTFYAIFSGVDWKGAKFTTLDELLKSGDITKFGSAKAITYKQTPSTVAYLAKSYMPIQLQNLISVWIGEMEFIDAITTGAGLKTTTTYSSERDKKYGKTLYTERFADTKKELTAKVKFNEEKGIIDTTLSDRLDEYKDINDKILDKKHHIDEYSDVERHKSMTVAEKNVKIAKYKKEINELAKEGLKQ